MTVLTQDGSVLLELLADAPPWVKVIGAILLLLAPFLPALIGALVKRISRSPAEDSTGSSPGSVTTPPSSPSGAAQQPVERYDAKMALIERMLSNVEAEQEHDRQEMRDLRVRVRDLEQQLRERDDAIRTRDATIAELRRTIDQLTGRPRYGPETGPTWPLGPQQGRSPGN